MVLLVALIQAILEVTIPWPMPQWFANMETTGLGAELGAMPTLAWACEVAKNSTAWPRKRGHGTKEWPWRQSV
jgi:hypothetical protein